MRLNRLDLTRYGKFTDERIDFGESRSGVPDLHVVYGPNEAGKSTALAAYLDLLFGIDLRSPYNFVHPYSTMRVGAAIETASGLREIVRVKTRKDSLLDGQERPIGDGALIADLGGLERASYNTMFSLDDKSFEAGGESILASQGDLGQLLFSASAGLADLGRGLAAVREEADRFYKKSARSGALIELKVQLGALKQKRDEIDTRASAHAQLVEERDRAGRDYETGNALLGRLEARKEDLRRRLAALPRLAELREIRIRLIPLADLPAAPPGWTDDLPGLRDAEIKLATRAEETASEIGRLEGEIGAIVVDACALRLAAEADRLDDLRARYTTADRDLPERRLRLREADLKVRDILVRIERPDEADPHRLILGASIVGQLRDFIEERSGIEARKTAALAEYEAARHRLDEAEAALRNAGDGSEIAENHAAMSLLATTLAALRADDHAARRRLAERSRAKHRAELDERLGALRPWTGDAGALAGLAVPQAPDLERWRTVLAAAEKRLSACTAEVDGLTAKHARMEAELVAIGSVGHLIGDREATTIRAGREKAWSSHRRTLDAASADLFEAAMREDDIVTNARLGHAAEVAKLNRLRQDLAADESTLARARDLQAAAAADVSRVRGEIAAAVAGALPGFAGDTLLPQLEAWLGRREKALETRAALREAEHELHAADADAASARERLATALAAAGIPHDVASGFDTLSAVALSALDRETSLRTLREAVEGCRRDVARRERGAKDAGRADDVWAAGWKHACAGCWLGEDGTAPSLATVRESLDVIAGLGPALDARAGLADRIEKMERDQAAFAAQVASAEAALGLADTSSPVLQRAQAIAERIEEARDARARKAEKASDLERMRGHQRKLAVERDELNRRKAAMTAHFGVDTLAEVDAKLRDIAHKAGLEGRAEAASRDILLALPSATIAEAEQALDAADRIALEADLSALTAQAEDQRQRCQELFAAHVKAKDRVDAIGDDDAVAALEERRRTTLLEIQEGALRYLRLRAGAEAAEQALRVYRERHRSSMMAKASNAFRTMTRGAYAGLTTQRDKDSEVLIAVGADGGSKIVAALSRGTRFQLYLALRVAGYHEFARSRPTVPFIADDIMDPFDELRAEEAFRLFADMAEVGQVVYLTHHRHIAEIAQAACPAVRLHRLGMPAG